MALTKAKLLELIENGDIPSGGGGSASNGLPQGGTAGQYLKKNSATDFDAGWADKPTYNAQDVGALPITGGTLTGDLYTNGGFFMKKTILPLWIGSDAGTNFNNFEMAWSFAGGYAQNKPAAGYWFVCTMSAGNERRQVAYLYNGNDIYTRARSGTTWTAWVKIV